MNGLLVIDKSNGMTSHDVVSRLRKLTNESSIGHLGTLDPMATGVLPLLLGKHTRLAQYFSTAVKSYTGHIRFGFATDTYDAEGQPEGPITEPHLALDQIRNQATYFHGEMDQMPPKFSAKKIDGQPAYKLAREGKPVLLKTARIYIHHFAIKSLDNDTASFTITVSAGGYVRSVAHELGQRLNCGAHLSSLRRTHAGAFSLEDAHTLEELAAADNIENLTIHPRKLLPELPSVNADTHTQVRLRNGAQANLPEFSDAPLVKVFAAQRELIAIARRVAGTLFQPVTVMG